ncbi:hypothetical protein [Mesonia aestuariivivens]|uniref:Uncharacterized protein n=1 Tax=Mesonia aestuariivivens TaxID=2796128 RepID=A0ABS6W578_9FLAO|nr:hypothetical protein [Mesonia aestuariivivens]MBW2962869.1 hypothetical protein [Mesonia aestuariivivens]
MSEIENRPSPFSKDRFKITLCKVIFFYSVFFVVMKIMALFNGYPMKVSLIMSTPFVLLSLWGLYIVRNKTFNWLYVILGILVVSLVRYYELSIFDYLVN